MLAMLSEKPLAIVNVAVFLYSNHTTTTSQHYTITYTANAQYQQNSLII